MILQILVLLLELLIIRKQMSQVPMVFIISRGVNVVVICKGGEVLQVEDRVAVSVLAPHGFVAGETSPVVESIFL